RSITEVVMEMPRCFSLSIQSEVAWRSDLRDFTVPATAMALPISSSFSVMVVLPASGWEMMAKVRRLATSAAWVVMDVCLAGIVGGRLSSRASVKAAHYNGFAACDRRSRTLLRHTPASWLERGGSESVYAR